MKATRDIIDYTVQKATSTHTDTHTKKIYVCKKKKESIDFPKC